MKIGNFTLEQTCGACPEQYDVFKDGEPVAYLRLGDFVSNVLGLAERLFMKGFHLATAVLRITNGSII